MGKRVVVDFPQELSYNDDIKKQVQRLVDIDEDVTAVIANLSETKHIGVTGVSILFKIMKRFKNAEIILVTESPIIKKYIELSNAIRLCRVMTKQEYREYRLKHKHSDVIVIS